MISLFAFLSVVYNGFYIRSGKTQFACIVHNKDQHLINTIVTCSLHDRGTRLSNKKPGMNSDAVSAPHAAPVLVPQTKAWFMRSPPWHDRYGISVSQITMDMFVGCPFVLFLLAIVLSVLLRYTNSDYPFWYLQTLLPLTVQTSRFLHGMETILSYVMEITQIKKYIFKSETGKWSIAIFIVIIDL